MVHSPLIMQMPKRQRRLTLTAMTGALGDLSQEEFVRSAKLSTGSLPSLSEQDVANVLSAARPSLGRRDSSPGNASVVTFRCSSIKRTRDSLGPDIGAQRMMQRAAERVAATQLPDDSDSSDSSGRDDEDSSLGMRLRRQKAFECGVKAAEGVGDGGWADKVGEGVTLSPRAFARGARAAEVAAKMAQKMDAKRKAAQGQANSEVVEPAPKRAAGPGRLALPKSWGGALEVLDVEGADNNAAPEA